MLHPPGHVPRGFKMPLKDSFRPLDRGSSLISLFVLHCNFFKIEALPRENHPRIRSSVLNWRQSIIAFLTEQQILIRWIFDEYWVPEIWCVNRESSPFYQISQTPSTLSSARTRLSSPCRSPHLDQYVASRPSAPSTLRLSSPLLSSPHSLSFQLASDPIPSLSTTLRTPPSPWRHTGAHPFMCSHAKLSRLVYKTT